MIIFDFVIIGTILIVGIVLGTIITCWFDCEFVKYIAKKTLGKKYKIRKGMKVNSLENVETLHSTVLRLKELNKMIVDLKGVSKWHISTCSSYYSLTDEEREVVVEALEEYMSRVERAISKYVEVK